jgi:hypothetical protein
MMVDLALMLSIRYRTEIEWGALSGSWAYKTPTLTLRELPISLFTRFYVQNLNTPGASDVCSSCTWLNHGALQISQGKLKSFLSA